MNAQYYFFGRNKVQYNEFDWYILKTEHFDIYYYKEFEEIADIGAYYAEEAYDKLKVRFNSVVTRRIPLIFYNTHIHFQQTNTTPGFIPEGVGGFFEFLKGRVVIPFMGSLEGFRHVITHELVHVFMTNTVYRELSDRRLSTDRLPPLWFTEGLAEYWSTKWDAQGEMVLRDAIDNNYFPGISNINRIYGSFLMYKVGQNFLEFVSEQYGEEKILMMVENIWQFDDFEKLLEYVLNKRLEDVDKEWLYYLKQKYYPLLSRKIPPSVRNRPLTDFGFNFSPSFYRNEEGKWIYFVANRNGYSSLYRLKLNDSKKHEVPDTEVIVQGEKEEIFETFHLFEPALDVAKSGLAVFVTKSGKTDALHIYSISEGKVVSTLQNDQLISISSPKWSSDSKKIVFSAVDIKGYPDIFLYDMQSGNFTRITNDYYSDTDPVFSPGDSTIVFSSDRTGGLYKRKLNLFEYRFSENSLSYLTYVNSNLRRPEYSPLDGQLYFLSDHDGVNNIWKMSKRTTAQTSPAANDIPAGTLRQVTNFQSAVFDYTFISPGEIALSCFDNSGVQIFRFTEGTVADSLLASDNSEFLNAGTRWYENKIVARTTKDKLKYENQYTLDYAQSQVSTDPVYGTNGGAVLSLSDLFGDDNYYIFLYNTAEVQSELLKSFNVAISRVNVGDRTNYAYGLFHYSGRRYDIRDSDEYYFERSFGGYFTMLYPLSKFDRIEANITVANSDKQVITNVISRKALLVSNSISFVRDNSLWGPTGPLDGSRIRLLLGFTNDVKFSNVNYFTAIADYRYYLRLSFRTALAMRAAAFYNEGKEARRYFMGGSWDLRGYPRWTIRGEKLWLSSVELRFPLIDLVYLKLPVLSLGFPNIRGALFFDSGGAWDDEYRETLGSIGGGIRINVFNILTFRYDIGKKIEDDFSRFQSGYFYQFFFGWDF